MRVTLFGDLIALEVVDAADWPEITDDDKGIFK